MSNDNPKMWLSQNHFLEIRDGKLYFWDYENHHQYEVSMPEVSRLMDYSQGAETLTEADHAFLDAGILTIDAPRSNWGWDELSRIFHIGTNHPHKPSTGVHDEKMAIEYAKSYLEFCQTLIQSTPAIQNVKGGRRLKLPVPELQVLEDVSLWKALASRRTCREFLGTATPLSKLSTLAFSAFGAMEADDPDSPIQAKRFGYRRTSPSAGGLQSTEPYIWVLNVDGLKPGIYHYLSCDHELEVVQDSLPDEPLSSYLCNQHWANGLSFAFFLTSRFDKMWWKYPHSRAYRPMLMDIGHLSQTLNLCITACGLNPWMTGYFHDREINSLLKLDPDQENVLFMVGAGNGTGSSYTRETRLLLGESP